MTSASQTPAQMMRPTYPPLHFRAEHTSGPRDLSIVEESIVALQCSLVFEVLDNPRMLSARGLVSFEFTLQA